MPPKNNLRWPPPKSCLRQYAQKKLSEVAAPKKPSEAICQKAQPSEVAAPQKTPEANIKYESVSVGIAVVFSDRNKYVPILYTIGGCFCGLGYVSNVFLVC